MRAKRENIVALLVDENPVLFATEEVCISMGAVERDVFYEKHENHIESGPAEGLPVAHRVPEPEYRSLSDLTGGQAERHGYTGGLTDLERHGSGE